MMMAKAVPDHQHPPGQQGGKARPISTAVRAALPSSSAGLTGRPRRRRTKASAQCRDQGQQDLDQGPQPKNQVWARNPAGRPGSPAPSWSGSACGCGQRALAILNMGQWLLSVEEEGEEAAASAASFLALARATAAAMAAFLGSASAGSARSMRVGPRPGALARSRSRRRPRSLGGFPGLGAGDGGGHGGLLGIGVGRLGLDRGGWGLVPVFRGLAHGVVTLSLGGFWPWHGRWRRPRRPSWDRRRQARPGSMRGASSGALARSRSRRRPAAWAVFLALARAMAAATAAFLGSASADSVRIDAGPRPGAPA